MADGDTAPPPPASLSGLISTLVPVLIISAVWFSIFLILRRSKRRFYAPRTYLGSLREQQRTPALPNGLFNWFGAFWRIPDTHVLQHQSLDAFLFIRFMKIATVICFVGVLITWPILFPVNATGGGGQQQLDVLSYGNIDKATQSNRYFAHALVCWVYFGFIMYVIMRECIYYINLRQAFMLSPMYANRISSRTVLFTSVPEPYLDEARLRKVFGDSVKTVWITGDTTEVDKIVEERDKVAYRLEKAEIKLIKLANKARQAAIKKSGAAAAGDDKDATVPLDAESGSIAARWVPVKKRPSHKLGTMGLVGKKVDTINWCRTELERLIPATEAEQVKYRSGQGKKIPGVFIEFRTQADAEAANQVVTHHSGLQMSPRFIGITPGEVVWKSLTIPWWQRVVRGYAVNAFIFALILFWAIPVAIIGIISNIQFLENLFFLEWLKKVPSVIMGVITGLLPSVLLAVLMALVPIIMRLCAKLAGAPSLSRVELFTQNAYFAFQVVQVFLVATIASSATAVAEQIRQHPESITTILSANLPKASNLYISYFIVQGLSIAVSVLSQVIGFFIFTVLYKVLANTPRAMYQKWANLTAISWGSVLPVYTNILVISMVYSCIAPLVLAWSTIAMGLFYLAWRYNVLFVTDTGIDTRGLIYPRALKQLFTGLYVAEITMIGLLGASVATGPLVLMVFLLIFTILFHLSLNHALDPLLYNLPMTLLAESGANIIPGGDLESAHHGAAPVATTSNGTNGKTAAAPVKKPNVFTKFLKPWQHADYSTLRQLVPVGADFSEFAYTEEVERDAYYPPSVTSPAPLLWIPQDAAGVSRQEVAHTARVIPITDEGCELNDKGKLVWDRETTRPPVWAEKPIY